MRKVTTIFCVSLLLFSIMFIFYGCGGPAEQKPPSKPPEPKELSLPPAEGGIATTSLLKLTPENAQLSVVLPSLAEGLDKIVQTAKRFYSADEVDTWVQRQVSMIASFADTPEAKTLIEVAEGRGFDITKPVGTFVDFKPSFDSLQKLLGPSEEGQAESQTTGQQNEPAHQQIDLENIDWTQVTQPNWVVMLGVKDKDKVEESLKELAIEVPEISASAPQEVIVDGAKVIDYGVYAYFIADGYVIVGSSSLVKGVANRFSSPYPIRYGVDIPSASYPEGVVLIKDWELLPMANKLMPLLVKSSPYAILGQLKAGAWAEMLPEEKDPVYICFSLNPNEKAEIRVLMDMAKRPKYANIMGEAKPLELLKILPDATQASIVLQFTNEYKAYLEKTALPQVKEALADKKGVAQGLQYGVSSMKLFGNEVGVAITSPMGDFPAIIAIFQASNVEGVEGLLNMLVPSTQDETYREIPIRKVAVPSPIPINLIMVKDKVIASNNTDVLKSLIDTILDEKTTGYLAGLKPPLDPGIPRYNFISLQSKLVLDTIFPLMNIMGKSLGGIQRDVEKALAEIQEVRLMNEKKGNILEGQAIIYFVPKSN